MRGFFCWWLTSIGWRYDGLFPLQKYYGLTFQEILTVTYEERWQNYERLRKREDKLSYSAAYQTVQIPEDAQSVTLSYQYYPISQDPLGLDFQGVWIYDANFAELRQLMHDTSNEQAWLSQTHDLSDFIGQEVLLYFQVYGDGDQLPSTMYLDEVSLQICK